MSTTTTTLADVWTDWPECAAMDPWYEEYLVRRQALVDAGQYPYNDDFLGHFTTPITGHWPGRPNRKLEESTVIYFCQVRFRMEEIRDKVEAKLAEGYVPIDHLPRTEKFRGIFLFPVNNHNGECLHCEDARMVIEIDGRLKAVLPKGKRTHGHLVMGRKVLVLR